MVSIILGTIYYLNMSLSIDKSVNCSFSANIYTDIGAFIAGCILIYLGYHEHKYKNLILSSIGTIIITEHVY